MLQENVKIYAERVGVLENVRAALKERREQFDRENESLYEDIKRLDAEINELKTNIQNDALFEFSETGNKKLFGGIGIREKTVMNYDEATALAFAKEKDMFLALDKKAFEAAAPSLGLSFVSVHKDPQVTFPREVKIDEI